MVKIASDAVSRSNKVTSSTKSSQVKKHKILGTVEDRAVRKENHKQANILRIAMGGESAHHANRSGRKSQGRIASGSMTGSTVATTTWIPQPQHGFCLELWTTRVWYTLRLSIPLRGLLRLLILEDHLLSWIYTTVSVSPPLLKGQGDLRSRSQIPHHQIQTWRLLRSPTHPLHLTRRNYDLATLSL